MKPPNMLICFSIIIKISENIPKNSIKLDFMLSFLSFRKLPSMFNPILFLNLVYESFKKFLF